MKLVRSHLSTLLLGTTLFGFASAGCAARDCDEVKEVGVKEGESQREDEEGACVRFVQQKKWWGEAEEFTGAYDSGKNVTVSNGNGDIEVIRTDRMDIAARFDPFVSNDYDTCNGEEDTGNERCAEIDDDLAKQELIFTETDGNYVIQAVRTDAPASLGAEIVVELPNSFDGRLSVAQTNGSTEVGPMGNAAAVIVESNNGSCDINTGAAPHIDILCENGSTDVVIGAITTGGSVKQIYKTSEDLGDMTVQFPSTDAPFSVSARSVGSDVLLDPADVTSVGCEKAGEDPRSVTVSCNGATQEDPVYEVRSDGSLVDINLSF